MVMPDMWMRRLRRVWDEPAQDTGAASPMRFPRLRVKMQEAIKKEKFEEAAKIRDEIKSWRQSKMAFEELLKSSDAWFSRSGPLNGTVCFSTCLVSAEILRDGNFPHHASAAEQREIVETVQRAILTEPDLSHLHSSVQRSFVP